MPTMNFPMPKYGGEGSEFKPKPLPDHCLVRLIDVTVQPGKTYEYRLRARMANPNYGRVDVASPSYGREVELPPGEWSTKDAPPIIVRVEPELNYYAINQEQVERHESKDPSKLKYSDHYSKALRENELRPERFMFFQAHQWLEKASHRGNQQDFGEWSVAERFPVARGEYVGRSERVELPIWRSELEDFIIATDATTTKGNPGISVNFGYDARGPQPEAILVDFEQGPSSYNRVESRTEDKVTTKAIRDSSAGEALLLTPDGRLQLLETVKDSADTVRKERLKKVKDRAREIKNRGKDESDDKEKKDKDKGKKPFSDT
jgi:hypothetical protein